MTAFRKIAVLAALVVLVATMASAQVVAGAMTCTANAAVPPTLRAEGLTELVGDIVIDCVGGQPTPAGQAIPQANITVFLNTNITSRLIVESLNALSAASSEALLLVDEPGAPGSPATGGVRVCAQLAGCSITGTGSRNDSGYTVAGTEPYIGTIDRPNTWIGIAVTNSLQFIGVPIDPPGTSGHRIFRITNVRANASGVSGGPAGTPGTIQALVSISGSTALPISNPTQVVGYVQQGLVFNVRARGDVTAAPSATALAYPQCNSLSRTAGSATNAFILQFQENFPTAFKVRSNGDSQDVPGRIYNTESGFYRSGGFPNNFGTVGSTRFGLADTGTRLKAVFANIPNGVNLYVSTTQLTGTASSSTALANLLTGEVGLTQNASATNTDFPVNSGVMGGGTQSATQLVPVGGAVTAVWEVVGANALSADSYAFGVWFSWTGNAAQNLPAPGIGTVTGGFAPTPTGMGVSTTTAASGSSSLNIPRFVDGTQTRNILTVYVCRTNILFPFVTNQGGFDTGLAISNTSTDPFGTATQAGGCTLFAYGDNAGASVPTGTVASGKTVAVLASNVMTNFQGYVIAQCAFQYAHGFAFVSDFGARNLAMGYLGIIIPEPGVGTRAASPLSMSAAGSGEQLGQ
jgi:hypothetical protein